jgi:WD40 repeat protein
MSLAIINLSTGQVDEFGFGHEDPIVKLVVTYDERGISVGRDGLIQVWELDEEHFPLGAFRTKAPFSDLSVSSDVRRILASSWDKTLWLFSGDLRLQARLTGHTDRVLACAIAPDGRRAISAAADRTLRIWDLETGSALSILTGHTADVTGCAFTGDGRRIVSRSKDGRIGLWDGGSGSLVAFTTGHTDWVNAFALAEEEGVVYSCSEDQTVRAWDLVTGEPRGVVYGVSPFRSLAAMAGGVYAGDEAGNLWILEYGEGLRRAVA